jgi:hypothetical protein
VSSRVLAQVGLTALLCCAETGCGSDESIAQIGSPGTAGTDAGASGGAGGLGGTGGAGAGAPWTSEDLLDVWGSEARDVWTVGTNGSVLHYDGSGWAPLSSGTELQLSGVAGSSRDDVWMVGSQSIVLHWDGTNFNLTLGDARDRIELLGVWSSGTQVFTSGISAGIAYLHQFDGTKWLSGTLNQAGSLWDIWGNSVEDVWAVGTGRNNAGFLLRWDGQAWDFTQPRYEGEPLRSVWGTSPNDVWTVAYEGGIQHWDGTAWQVYPANFRLFGIWGSGAADVWAIGAEGLLVHFDGTAWSEMASGTRENLWGIWGSAPDDVWIVGGNGTILHFDGQAWTPSLRTG